MIHALIKFFLHNKVLAIWLMLVFLGWGISTAPFDWKSSWWPRDPVPVDALPDIGENQQIIFTSWPGRSPQDVEDQITYPLSTTLTGIAGIKTIRASSMYGFSSIYLIFEDEVDFYWSRSRILEKLNALPSNLLPAGVKPGLGPDATGLGQIFWYTLEGRDPEGQPTGGWDPHELRSIQDYQVRYALAAAKGVSEVASIGGYVKEYQIEVDPTALAAHQVSLAEVGKAVQETNLDAGARTLEINQVEYLVRGLGYVKTLEDLEEAVVVKRGNTPLRIKDLAQVQIGPAARRGILDKAGAEAVGGVVVGRYGENPLAVIEAVKDKIAELQAGLPSKVLADGQLSQLTIVPFYDRTQLIQESLGTLNEALELEILLTIIVIILMVMNLRTALLVSSMLPLAVLMSFIAMRYLGVDANIVALSGIAIAIGTMVDIGIILTENMLRHLHLHPKADKAQTLLEASREVAPAILTAVSTTIISFIPVFTLEAAEGKLFHPLAYTKTFALVATLLIVLTILPALAHLLFSMQTTTDRGKKALGWGGLLLGAGLIIAGFILDYPLWPAFGVLLMLSQGLALLSLPWWRLRAEHVQPIQMILLAIAVSLWLAKQWLPLGPSVSLFLNSLFILTLIGGLIGGFRLVQKAYPRILAWCLDHKALFLSIPSLLVVWALVAWLGFAQVFGFVARGFDLLGVNIRTTDSWSYLVHAFPKMGDEFMPALDEGAFLLMPTSMPHAGMDQNKLVLQYLDMAVQGIPEVEMVVGKLGRVESALDPAPISMYENVILYKSEYKTDENGNRLRFQVNWQGNYLRDETGELIPDSRGKYFRQWRPEIRSPQDIWDEIARVTQLPGVTAAPKLQPIETRLVMLQTGMRAPLGIKVQGPNLQAISEAGRELEKHMKQVPGVKAEAVFAERIVGKPYLNLNIDRAAIARYGLSVQAVQQSIQMAIGGMSMGQTVEGRERYNIQVRYAREYRDHPEGIESLLVLTPDGQQVPLGELVEMEYVQGPQVIKSENTFLTAYVLFDREANVSESAVVENAQAYLDALQASGQLQLPEGVSYRFAGNYEQKVRAWQRLILAAGLCFLVIFMILYLQFRSISLSLMIFFGIAVAFSGGILMLELYGWEGFLNIQLGELNLRDLFQVHPINMSVAVGVGFIALFGIATDDGVLIGTYLEQVFAQRNPQTRAEIRAAVIEAGTKRVRPALMTTATTLLALLPVLSSTGRGADVMIPMAIPVFGGMSIALLTIFVLPVLYGWWKERNLPKHEK
ncbi:MAG: efflux RND transporter permease subunit [Bacteroidota bacterium]